MPWSSSTAFSEPWAPPEGLAACFLLIPQLLLGLVVVDLFLFRLGRRRLFLLELLVVQLPVPGQGLRADHKVRRDAGHVQVRLLVLVLLEPEELERHGRLLHA